VDVVIIAYGIDGDKYKFRLGVKSDGPDKLLKMPPLTAPLAWPPVEDIKRAMPHLSEAKDGQWCWHELPLR
jgi:hypothetical protein